MQQKIVRLLSRPLLGTKNPERKLFKFLPWFVFGFIKCLRWTTLSLLGVSIVWIVVGNLVASWQEKEIELAWEEFAKQFPKTGPNDSALKLRVLIAKLGIGITGTDEFPIDAYSFYHPDFDSSETDSKAFENIREPLDEYLDNQFAKLNDEIDTPSEELLNYLESKTEDIKAISDHILQSEVPHWETDINAIVEGGYSFALPSLLNLANLQKVLALEVMEKTRNGNRKAALDNLEVSWKINQSLRKRPELISQLVALIITRYIIGVMRKIDDLPKEWQERLLGHDYRNSIVKSIIFEYFVFFKLSENEDFQTWSFFEDSGYDPPAVLAYLFYLPDTAQAIAITPYFRLSAIDIYSMEMQVLSKVYEQNTCLYESVQIYKRAAWWNVIGKILNEEMPNLERNAVYYMLDLELTQKILQIKELAAKTGKWPPKLLPDMKSSICPGSKWVYHIDDGTMSISLSQQPEWLLKRIEENRNLPLMYSDRTPPPKKQDASEVSPN